MIFFKDTYTLPKILTVESSIEELNKLIRLKLDPFDRRIAEEDIHKFLSVKFFNAVERRDYDIIIKILEQQVVLKTHLLKDGQTILEYLINTSNNDVFLKLFNEYKKHISPYFRNTPSLFIAALNKKNYEIVVLFLKDEILSGYLKKEQLANVFFVAIENEQDELAKYFVEKYNYVLSEEIIEATMIYFIANDKMKEFSKILDFEKITMKFNVENIEKMLAYSVLNKNIKAVSLMMTNNHFMNVINNGDVNMQKSILNLINNTNILL
ncbi:MAG: hypothetical protein LBC92_05115 [Rickettsiales bacterium]|jgi:hypothetical protein|nr:hypothetical protein [Rickettsiales bacterium]